jgi:nucleotide-binding universal stress UspA family protein
MRIVVGTDGSAPSLAAVRWAASEAARSGGVLEVLLAHHGWIAGRQDQPDRTGHERALWTVEEAGALARAVAPELRVDTAVVPGDPAPALMTAAEDADLLVVGSRGHGRPESQVAGSVSLEVATRAPGRVAVVRGRADAQAAPVVVGACRSADEAIEWGFEEADRRGCPLVAVHAYIVAFPPWATGPPAGYAPDRLCRELGNELVEQVAPWRDKYPGVPVECVVTEGSPAAVLTRLSRPAQLLVVGPRTHHGLAGPRLGSVGQQLVHHADCPVVIARTRPKIWKNREGRVGGGPALTTARQLRSS